MSGAPISSSRQRQEVVLASNNRHKIEELRALLPGSVRLVSASETGVELPEETGTTFVENALLKARAAAKQTGRIAIADDSGLEVDALGGAPGVRSARFAGEPSDDAANNALLLRRLSDVPPDARTARFRSVVAVVTPDGAEFVSEGTLEGAVRRAPRGSGGFGYDPLFVPQGLDRTLAELTMEEKNRVSHRGQAVRRAIASLLPLLDQMRDMTS